MNKFFTCVDNYISDEECLKYINTYNDNIASSYIYNNTKPLPIASDHTVQKIYNDFNIQHRLDNLEIDKEVVYPDFKFKVEEKVGDCFRTSLEGLEIKEVKDLVLKHLAKKNINNIYLN